MAMIGGEITGSLFLLAMIDFELGEVVVLAWTGVVFFEDHNHLDPYSLYEDE